ncbi:MAG: hypothetical protein Q7K35_05740 [bacterium]|nr:hypothetical protein [bacterium]
MFNFFKKKPDEQPAIEDAVPAPVLEKQIQIDDIAIHTMPERFRHQPVRASSAKTTGIIIIGGGVVVLILVSAGVYYFLFRQPSVTVKSEPPAAEVAKPVDQSQNQPEANQNIPESGTLNGSAIEPVILPIDDIATSTATSTPEAVEEDLTVGLTPGLDGDSDGLTDAEEILLGSGTSTPDTDGDLYLDGAEMLNLYNPAGSDKLAANPSIAAYENKTFNYSVLYPNAWQSTVNGGDDSIMFKTADNQFFQIIVQPNAAGQPLDEWYMDQLGVTFINDIDRLNGVNWQGIKSSDGLTLYLMDLNQKNIFTLAYNPGENNILEYINIFNMMIKSFTLK